MRRFGFDIYHHMAGGRRFPVRIWPLPTVGPLQPHSRPFFGSMMVVAATGIALGFEIDIEHCTSFVGFSFRTGGWNPHVATLEEYLRNPSLRYEESSLYRLHESFRPATLQELFLEDEEAPLEPLSNLPAVRPLFRYVWAVSPSLIEEVGHSGQHPGGHHYFGPMPPEKGQAQFERLIKTYRSIEEEGFQPERYGPIMGYFLADDTSYRFVVGSGNHRLAALKVLGHTTVPVCLTRTHPAVIHRSRLDSWTVDQGGPFEAEAAHALFEKLINEDGLAKARNLGVLGAAG